MGTRTQLITDRFAHLRWSVSDDRKGPDIRACTRVFVRRLAEVAMPTSLAERQTWIEQARSLYQAGVQCSSERKVTPCGIAYGGETALQGLLKEFFRAQGAKLWGNAINQRWV